MIGIDLQEYATKEIWCAPSQDKQRHFRLRRITPAAGVKRYVTITEVSKKLPDDRRFHVFVIGQINPSFFNIKTGSPDWLVDVWRLLSDDLADLNLTAMLYNTNGFIYPRYQTYYTFINEHSLAIAIPADKMVNFDVAKEPLFFRTYSNGFFNSSRRENAVGIEYRGKKITSTNDILTLQDNLATLSAEDGFVFCYRNGVLINTIDLTYQIGDHVELLLDTSVISVERYKLRDLMTFLSIKDAQTKYLLFRDVPKPDYIQFYDDNELYIENLQEVKSSGLMYYRHTPQAVRMVTDKDYSLDQENVTNIARALHTYGNDPSIDLYDFYVTVVVREAGLKRALVYSDLRLHELYKLNNPVMLNALLSTNESATVFRAETLENGMYFALTEELDYSGLTKGRVVEALGYNAINKLVADTPNKVVSEANNRYVEVPPLMQFNSTAYEYNSYGLMLGYYRAMGPIYIPTNATALYVEFINGEGSYRPHSAYLYGDFDYEIGVGSEFTIYRSHVTLGVHDDYWEKVPDGPEITVSGGVLSYRTSRTDEVLLVVTTARFYSLDMSLRLSDGTFYFPIPIQQEIDGEVFSKAMNVPYARTDVFLNGRLLSEGLDYTIKDFYINIYNKKYLNQSIMDQSFHFRFYGIYSEEIETVKKSDRGFISYGTLSDNSRFDVRDDRVMTITVDGLLRDQASLYFDETTLGVSITDSNNGLPYQLLDAPNAIKAYTGIDSNDLRLLATKKDSAIINYFSSILPVNQRELNSAIVERYPVYSPFISRIIHDLLDGGIPSSVYTNQYNDNDVLSICSNYNYLLGIDPISLDMDDRFVIIHPHPSINAITLDVFKYRFMENVVRLYAKDKITLSHHIVL